MATAYVSSSGTAAYPGTVNAPTSLSLAFSSAGAGDIVYIAPGTYRGTFTLGVSGSSGNTIQFIGDVGATQNISGISPGIVRITNVITDTAFPTNATMLTATSRSYWSFESVYFEGYGTTVNQSALYLTTCSNFSFTKCTFVSQRQPSVVMTTSAGVSVNASFSKCTFATASTAIVFAAPSHSGNYLVGLTITDCLSLGNLISMSTAVGGNTSTNGGNVLIYNCTALGGSTPLLLYSSNTATPSIVRNSIFLAYNGFIHGGTTGSCDEDYNVVWGDYFSMSVGANTIRGGTLGLDYGFSALAGIPAPSFFGPYLGSRAIANGVLSGAPATDIDGVPWYQTTPDRASYTYAGRNNVIRFFNPSDTNSITIAPGSTSQTIELYLGATGLTASTSGLSAYYNRTRSTDVQIPLVARTIGEAWTSGGFAEVNASTMPGVYRLDLPDAAVAAGADDVTVVVRGASGTNGAVMTVKLSSGGLTAAQTAQAVLDAVASTHNNIGSIGAFIQDKTGYSLSTSQTFSTTGSVGSVTGNVTGNVTGTVGGVVGNIVGNLTGSVGTVATPDNIIDGVWDEQRVGHTASGSFGEKLQTNAMADEILARDLGSGLNAGTAEERTVRSALRALRNKVNVGSSQMVVKKEDDTTDAWTASVTTTAVSSNVSGIDPN
jgi:hypothetical protein